MVGDHAVVRLAVAAGASRRTRRFDSTAFLRAAVVAGGLGVVALEAGWITTEVGRQPWIVFDVMRVEDAVTE